MKYGQSRLGGGKSSVQSGASKNSAATRLGGGAKNSDGGNTKENPQRVQPGRLAPKPSKSSAGLLKPTDKDNKRQRDDSKSHSVASSGPGGPAVSRDTKQDRGNNLALQKRSISGSSNGAESDMKFGQKDKRANN